MKIFWLSVLSASMLMLTACKDDKENELAHTPSAITSNTNNNPSTSNVNNNTGNANSINPSSPQYRSIYANHTGLTNTNSSGKTSTTGTGSTTNNTSSTNGTTTNTGNTSTSQNSGQQGSTNPKNNPPKSKLYDYFDVLPVISSCQTGKLKDSQKQQAVDVLNHMRSLHGLQPVTYDYAHDNEVMQSTLMMAANKKMSHNFSSSSKCFTTAGNIGSQTSNIAYMGGGLFSAERSLILWLTDEHNVSSGDTRVGHRRWLLNPFLQKISYGMSAESENSYSWSALKVIYDNNHTIPSGIQQNYVAYPVGNYPSKYFSKNVPLSFSVVEHPDDLWANHQVNFSNAKINIRNQHGKLVQVYDISHNYIGAGIPNSLEFRVKDLSYNHTYQVEISQVLVDGKEKNYNYWFNVQQ